MYSRYVDGLATWAHTDQGLSWKWSPPRWRRVREFHEPPANGPKRVRV